MRSLPGTRTRRTRKVPTRLGVVSNLRAGSRSRGRDAQRLEVPRHEDLILIETETRDDLPEALRVLAAKGVDVLAVDGGDGTLHQVLCEIMRGKAFGEIPALAPLRGGRTNMSAIDLGAQRSRDRAVSELFSACREGRLDERRVDRQVLRIKPGRGADPLYGFFVGTGLVRRAIEWIHTVFPTGRARGVFGGGVTTASVLLRAVFGQRGGILRGDVHRLAIDGEPIEATEYMLLMATTLQRLFLRLDPFWGREQAPVRFTGIAWQCRSLPTAIARVLAGRSEPLRWEDGYLSRNAGRLDIGFDCGFTIDGELFEPEADTVVEVTATSSFPLIRA